jgi:SAM-dependent methyltransferase
MVVKTQERLKTRKLAIWSRSFLTHKFLWNTIEKTVAQTITSTQVSKPIVIDVGCGNKPYLDLFVGCEYVGVDRSYDDAEPDMIGDAASIPLDDCYADIVFSTQVIEHVPDHQAMLDECYRILKPSGTIILTGPFYWPLHEEPNDFFRFSKHGFEKIFIKSGFQSIDVVPDSGDWIQILQSVNLKLPNGKLMLPAFVLFNLIGLILDKLDHSNKSPLNYIITAKK